jgi:ABC-type nitrate/sulfonate/bicarbonate transport system substrate-binding protein/outer membrane protein OmpA-like peptidoglycan-associated protein
MKEGRAKAILVIVLGWVLIVVVLAAAYRFFVRPAKEKKLAGETGSASQYEHHIVAAADSFSGYAILRSELLAGNLRKEGVKLSVNDDGANYRGRIEALRDGKLDFAVFTIDSFVSAGAQLGEFPGTIILVIDETKGADAMIAHEAGVKQIADLDHPEARIVLTAGSPSEFLARTVIAHFNLPRLPSDWLVSANGAKEVFREFKSADKRARRGYVLWEPYVSQALQEAGSVVLLDSGRLKGYIVDVLVARRDFLKDNQGIVETFIASYLRASYSYAANQDELVQLIIDDARKTSDERLSKKEALGLVEGIQFKNTLENYAHFGLLQKGETDGLQHIEDMITNITEVLLETNALAQDPVGGQANTLFYDRVLKQLQDSSFHPSKTLNIVEGLGSGESDLAKIRGEKKLSSLTETQWDQLREVGELRARPISFGRGTARINVQSQRELKAMTKRLEAWPQYYLTVLGHARSDGDADANRRLAEERAAAAADFLKDAGIRPERLRTKAVPLSEKGGAAQSVSFVMGQLPY